MGETSSLFKRLIGAWNDIAGSVTGNTKVSSDLSSQDDAESLREQMVSCLEARGGEVSARARAAALGHTYLELEPEGRQRFLRIVADEFGPNTETIDRAIAVLQTQLKGIEIAADQISHSDSIGSYLVREMSD